MYFFNQIAGILLAGTISLLIPGKDIYFPFTNNSYLQKVIISSFFFQETQQISQGYSDVAGYEEGFIAAGTDGRIDRISISGLVTRSENFPGEKFNCIISGDNRTIAAGDRGTILVSSENGIFRKVESHTRENINSLSLFKGVIIAGTDKGSILTGDGKESFKKIKLALKGNIVSVAARQSDCFGVTDEGEIIHSSDGIKWDITDFNQAYSGYYKQCFFKRVLVSENSIVIAGVRSDGSPVLLFSNYGNVWAEKNLFYTDDEGAPGFLEDKPNDILYDSPEDQFFLACANGKLMKLNSCSQCNKMTVLSQEDLTGIASNGNTILVVGDNFFIQSIVIR